MRDAARSYEQRVFSPGDGRWWWSCTCGQLGGGWPNRDLALDECEAHVEKHDG